MQRTLSLKPKEVISGFEDAAWDTDAALTVFLAKVSKAPPSALADVFTTVLCREEAGQDPRHSRRVDTFKALLLRGNPLKELFLPLIQGCPEADAPVLTMLLEVLPRLNDPAAHREVCALLQHPKRAIRQFGAQLLTTLGSVSAPAILAKMVTNPDFLGRREVLTYVVSSEPTRAGTFIVATLQHGTPAEKVAALEHLQDPAVVGENTAAALDLLLNTFRDPADAVVVKAISTYAEFCDAETYFINVVPGLGAVAQRIEVSRAILTGLLRFAGSRTLDTLEKAIEVGPLSVRVIAVEVLDQIGDDTVVPLLTEALAHPQVAVRSRATQALLRLGQGEVDLRRTVLWLMRNDDAEVRRLALHLAAHIKDADQQLWPALLDFLSDPDWWVRERLVDALVHLGGDAVVPSILRVLHGDSALARLYAIDVLENIANDDACTTLLDLAEHDEEESVRERAMQALAIFGDAPHVAEKMVELLASIIDPALEVTCLETLRALRARSHALTVAKHAKSPDSEVRASVVACLDDFDDPKCAQVVEAMLTDSQPWVRERAAALLDRWATYHQVSDVSVAAMSLDQMLMLAIEQHGDTVILAGRAAPLLRTAQGPQHLLSERLQPEQVKRLIYPILTPHQRNQLGEMNDVDTAYQIADSQLLFRLHVAGQRSGLTAVFSRSERELMPLPTLGLPAALSHISSLRSGLVLVAGAAKQGKSTTVHALIDHLNHNAMRHIITLETRLETVHQPVRSVITQREIGTHAARLDLALKAALREDPDVLVLDDMKSSEAIRFAVSAAETGHLVIGTVEAENTSSALEQLIGAFGAQEHDYVRGLLAGTLRFAVASRLVPRLAALPNTQTSIATGELLLHTPAVATLIREGKTKQLSSLISTSAELGMCTAESEHARHQKEGVIA